MDYRIARREVLNNLIRFKDHLLELRSSFHSEGENQKERCYKTLLNMKNGDMRFTKKIAALESHISQIAGKKESVAEWKQILIIVHQKTPFEAASFEIVDGNKRSLNSSELEPLAWKIASETLHLLNQKGREAKGMQGDLLAEEAALKDLSQVHLSSPKEGVEDLPGWMGSLSRVEAEKILDKKGIGTYLLREGDEITVSIAFHFSEENRMSIRPYILTVVENQEKISDILLLETDKGWTIYRDDPNLKDAAVYQFYPSPKGLIDSLFPTARFPLS